jgi:hypothetical protein
LLWALALALTRIGAGAGVFTGAGGAEAAAATAAFSTTRPGLTGFSFPVVAEAERALGAFFGAGDTGTGFLTGAVLAADLGRSTGRRASALRATGLAAGFLALADLDTERLAGICRSSKASGL